MIRKNRRIREPFIKRARRVIVKSSKVALIIGIISGAAYSGRLFYHKLFTTPYLAIKTINVTGTEKVAKEAVIDLSGLKGKNIFVFRVKDTVRSLKKNPWVEEAVVKRSLPDSINIEIHERRPVALVKMDDLYVMDGRGVIFKKFAREDNLDLPVITGLTMEGLKGGKGGIEYGLLELLDILQARSGFNLSRVSEIHADPTFGFSIYTLDEGVRLDVGAGAFEEKLVSFEKVLKARDNSLEGVEAMDLNNSRQVVVRFTANAVKEGGDRHGQKG